MFGGTCAVFPRHPQKLKGVSVEGWAILREPMRAEREKEKERGTACAVILISVFPSGWCGLGNTLCTSKQIVIMRLERSILALPPLANTQTCKRVSA